jgi:hypothetical protein
MSEVLLQEQFAAATAYEEFFVPPLFESGPRGWQTLRKAGPVIWYLTSRVGLASPVKRRRA